MTILPLPTCPTPNSLLPHPPTHACLFVNGTRPHGHNDTQVHHNRCWQGAEKPQNNAEVDDPFFALMVNMRLMRPKLRSRGGFEAPEEDGREPARTERALRRAFCWSPRWPWRCGGKEERAGDVLETLPMWTDDANQKKGIFYIYVQVMLQLAIAAQAGILFAHPFNETSVGNFVNLGGIITFQILLVAWGFSNTANGQHVPPRASPRAPPRASHVHPTCCFLHPASRLLPPTSYLLHPASYSLHPAPCTLHPAPCTLCRAADAFTEADSLSGFVVELVAVCLILAANVISANAGDDEEMLVTSLQLATFSSQLLIYSAFVPMAFTVYDSFIVPFVLFCWKVRRM